MNSSDHTKEKKGRPTKHEGKPTALERQRQYRDRLKRNGFRTVEVSLSKERVNKLDKMAHVRGVSRKQLVTHMLNRVVDRAKVHKPNTIEEDEEL